MYISTLVLKIKHTQLGFGNPMNLVYDKHLYVVLCITLLKENTFIDNLKLTLLYFCRTRSYFIKNKIKQGTEQKGLNSLMLK